MLRGSYNPIGYTNIVVNAQVKGVCLSKQLETYQEGAVNGDELILFQATCKGAPRFRIGAYEVERVSADRYIFEASGSN